MGKKITGNNIIDEEKKKQKEGGQPGVSWWRIQEFRKSGSFEMGWTHEPGTSCTRSKNYTIKPLEGNFKSPCVFRLEAKNLKKTWFFIRLFQSFAVVSACRTCTVFHQHLTSISLRVMTAFQPTKSALIYADSFPERNQQKNQTFSTKMDVMVSEAKCSCRTRILTVLTGRFPS